MIMSSTDTIPGRQVSEVLGVVSGNTVRARWLGQDVGAALKQVVGGEIKGYTEMLARSLHEEKDRERIEIIKTQVERVTRLIRTLMNFARPEPEVTREVAVEEILDRALALIAETARKRGIVTERDFGAEFPLNVQSERLERAFLDLLVNACEAMERHGAIEIRERKEGQQVLVEFEDDGPGIPGELMEKIFQPFFTTKEDGTGLGLSIATRIIEEHRGNLTASSNGIRGTVFTLRLPVKEQQP